MTAHQKEKKIETLQASIDTLSEQITRLQNYVSYLQVRIWKQRRARLTKQLLKVKSQ